MMTLISQMVGCLLIAAGIGFGVGWWMRQRPKRSPEHPTHDLAGQLRTKEQALDAMAHDLKVKTSAVQILEQKIMSSETLHSSVQRELIARNERLKALEAELTTRSKQLTHAEAEGAAARRRMNEMEATLATQTHELKGAQQTCRNAEQARDVMEREVGVLREHIVQLNEGLADRDRLRAQVKQLEATQDRVHQLEIELSDREAAHRTMIQQLEHALAERDQRIGEFDTVAAAQADSLRAAQQTCQSAEQAREVMEREVSALRDHIAQLNEGLADRDRLRAQVKQLQAAQDRIHQLEVELSDREAAHRTMIQQLELALTDRDRRIEDLAPATHLLREKEATITEWERTHAQTVQTLERETAKLLEQNRIREDLQAQHHLAEQRVQERDKQVATLQHELQDLHTERQALQKEVQSIPEKDEQIQRLQKRLRELRTTLRTTPATSTPAPAQKPRRNGAGTTAPGSPPKSSKPGQDDDLKKIHGIGPVFAETLQKLGTRTFIQIARWKPEDVEKIAKHLATDPERIKRENWIGDAKKLHAQKHKERL
ncbi:MAG: hypothetical protein KF682_06875 [Nitrospira sp.]|nr:hypothetical protein [Nitrospira sp.]